MGAIFNKIPKEPLLAIWDFWARRLNEATRKEEEYFHE
jgi:hypothetical protein